MARYLVIWEFDTDEHDAVNGEYAAAVIAFRAMRDPESIATVFRVQHPDGRVSQVDLVELSGRLQEELEDAPRFGSEMSKLLHRRCDEAIAAATPSKYNATGAKT